MIQQNKKQFDGFKIQPDADNVGGLRYIYYVNPPDIRVISFKGGGGRVAVYGKVLEILHENGVLTNAQEVGGSSSGSVASAFAAIHYEDPLKRTESLAAISDVDKKDVYGDTLGWKFYQVVTAPFYLLSKPFEWLATGLGWLATQCNKILPGRMIGIPLGIASSLCSLVSTLTSPRSYAAIFNLITKRGMYRGDRIQYFIRDRFRDDTEKGLNAILQKLNEEERQKAVAHLRVIGVYEQKEGRLSVVPDVTLSHLSELAKLPGSQFKEYYTTGMKLSDRSFSLFNKISKPTMPVHLAIRLAITFPTYFQVKSHDGHAYIDGGVIDNAPVRHAVSLPASLFHHKNNINDHIARLNIRVEYPEDFHHALWRERPVGTWLNRLLFTLNKWVSKLFTAGVDSYDMDDEVTSAMQADYAQRTIQLPDFNIGLMENTLSAAKRQEISEGVAPLVNDYFKNHQNEKVEIRHYREPADSNQAEESDIRKPQRMPLTVCIKLLRYLQNSAVKTADIFDMPEATAEELEILREREVQRLSELPSVLAYLQLHTNKRQKLFETAKYAVTTQAFGLFYQPIFSSSAKVVDEAFVIPSTPRP